MEKDALITGVAVVAKKIELPDMTLEEIKLEAKRLNEEALLKANKE